MHMLRVEFCWLGSLCCGSEDLELYGDWDIYSRVYQE